MHRALHFLLAAALGLTPSLALAQAGDAEQHIRGLTKASRATVRAIADTRVQVLKTMEAYDALLVEGAKDRERIHASLRAEAERLEVLRARMSARAALMGAEAEARFGLWARTTAALADSESRARRQERLALVESRYAAIRSVGQAADGMCAPFVEALRTRVGRADGVSDGATLRALEAQAVPLRERAESLVRRLGEAIAALEEAAKTLDVEPSR